jgi:ATP-dependent DNA helicase DinG
VTVESKRSAADGSGVPWADDAPFVDQAVAAVFAQSGPLARALTSYRYRPQQIELASSIAKAVRERTVLIAEAGTGTGKTVAYLVPALLYGGKVLISTGTKTLQDQLFHRDLPTVRDALGLPAQTALLKGRANYVCSYHLERHVHDGRLQSREVASHLLSIARFAAQSATGDRAELPDIPEISPAWGLATSTRENCLGQECPAFKQCFVMKARREALMADIVVVNHHLFFADAMLRDEGMAELLPACDTVILDEAHQLPEAATQFFGESISTGQVLDLCRDALVEARVSAPEDRILAERVRSADKAARDLRLAIPLKETRIAEQGLDRFEGFNGALDFLAGTMQALAKVLALHAERSEGLAACHTRTLDLNRRIAHWTDAEDEGMVRWIELRSQALIMHRSPLDVAVPFRRQIDARKRSWILTSATLAVGGSFSLYQQRLGLTDARTAIWPSPFDYPNNALLYLPEGIPDPADAEFTDEVVDACIPVLRASRGRAFLLFTSLRAMRRAHELLSERLAREGIDYPLLLQGQGTKTHLLESFRAHGNAVLIASSSFWEGVDVRGDALSLVVIDKLPFASPDDPVLAARLAWLNRMGRNGFIDYQVPAAAIALKQGAGRLIRDETDQGVLMICDRRIVARGYGKTILDSLPPMRRTRSLADVTAFFARLDQAAVTASERVK